MSSRTPQVILEGFKSYKDQTIVEPFSENINVVGESAVLAYASGASFVLSLLTLFFSVQSAQMGLASPTFSMVRCAIA